jgi:hypothetical protein
MIVLIFLFIFIPQIVLAYNRPGCAGWPTGEQWDAELCSKLSNPSLLYGPFYKNPESIYDKNCLKTNQDERVLLANGQGLCMHFHACANEKCQLLEKNNLPAYSVVKEV